MEKYFNELNLIKKTVRSIWTTTDFKKDIMIKDGDDIVTTTDLKVETTLIEMIKENFPTDLILSEETNNHRQLKGRTWIIDPVDGTSNYAADFGVYCTQIALFDQDDIVLSYIYVPDFKKEYYAIKRCGAYLNNQPIKTNQNEILSNALISFVGSFRREKTGSNLPVDLIKKSVDHNMKVRVLGSAGVELALLAEGIFSGIYTPITNIYDVAPGLLLIREAGAYIEGFNEKTYKLAQTPLFAWSNKQLANKF